MPQKIEEDYAEVDRLADEKLRLAQRMVALIARARARLDHDLSKVLILQGDLDPSQQNTFVMTGRNPVQQINESLRHAMTLADVPPAAPVAPTPAPPMKRACFRCAVCLPRRVVVRMFGVGGWVLTLLLVGRQTGGGGGPGGVDQAPEPGTRQPPAPRPAVSDLVAPALARAGTPSRVFCRARRGRRGGGRRGGRRRRRRGQRGQVAVLFLSEDVLWRGAVSMPPPFVDGSNGV